MEPIIARHGGYRKLMTFQLACLCYDVTVRFCERYVARGSRTKDQMVQAARSGVQNIAEGSEASGTSRKKELKLTSVARASLEELRLDYEDFLRQRHLPNGSPATRAASPWSADAAAPQTRWRTGCAKLGPTRYARDKTCVPCPATRRFRPTRP